MQQIGGGMEGKQRKAGQQINEAGKRPFFLSVAQRKEETREKKESSSHQRSGPSVLLNQLGDEVPEWLGEPFDL